jgi:two-component system OmpR family response regulator
MARVLVVDDEENISFLVATALRLDGHEITTAPTGREALDRFAGTRPDLIVLDVMLPDIDGFEVCRRLRADGSNVPIIFLTARDTRDDRVRGLTIGGDDYVVKPFSIEELMARVAVILRRVGIGGGAAVLTVGDLELDDDAHRVTRGGDEISLSPTEYKLLRYLVANAGRVLSRSQILDHVWEYDFGGDSSNVETYVSYLRKKVDSSGPKLIHTIRGIGYAVRVPRP